MGEPKKARRLSVPQIDLSSPSHLIPKSEKSIPSRRTRIQSQSPQSSSQLLLGWPTLTQQTRKCVASTADTSFSTFHKEKESHRKRSLSVTFEKKSRALAASTCLSSNYNIPYFNNGIHGKTNNTSHTLWCEKHQPKRVIDLCVAPKRIKEVCLWIEESLLFSTSVSQNARLLILVGSPGVGKSTMIQCLAAENNWEILEWSESYSTYIQQQIVNDNSILIDQQSPLYSFEQFLRRCGQGFSSLELVQSLENTRTDSKWKENIPNPESVCDSSRQNQIIVIDELPYLHGSEMEEQFRDILSQHIYQSVSPTVLIYSNVTEGKHRPDDLERLVDKQLLYSNDQVRIMQVHTPTRIRFKKCLEVIMKLEKIPISQSMMNAIDNLFDQCSGDIRSAINTLQFQLSSNTQQLSRQGSIAPSTSKDGDHPSLAIKDIKLSTFHTLGKMLYAKRIKTNSTLIAFEKTKISNLIGIGKDISPEQTDPNNTTKRPPLDFCPECLFTESSDIEIGKALQFLNYHCVEFFTDVCDLTTAMDHFSDAVMLLDSADIVQHAHYSGKNKNTSSISPGDSILFPTGYVHSLASRAVANANRHPAPTKFKQLTSPQNYQVHIKRNANKNIAQQMMHRLMTSINEPYNLSVRFCSKNDFLVDMLPFVRIIIPLSTLQQSTHSFFRQIDDNHDDDDSDQESSHKSNYFHAFDVYKHEEEDYFAKLLKEQEEILEFDDIVEDVDD